MKEKVIEFMNSKKLILIVFVLAAILFAIPSMNYLLENGTIRDFNEYFKFCLDDTNRVEQTIIYLVILTILAICYFFIVKNRDKLFKTNKQMYIFIAIMSIIFVIIVPFLSSDVFYYLGVGRLDSAYGQNPYYVTIQDFVESGDNSQYLEQDTVLAKGYENDWGSTTVVYGPVWTLICKIVAGISFGNIDISLLLFKLLNMVIHLVNCYLIYKITGKKLFVLLYGLNPYILIEGIANVHNDIYVVTCILASLYFLLKKKNIIVSIVFLALATAIKYFAILLLPFIIIYYFRDKKPGERLKNCILYGMLFVLIVVITYLLYIQDIQVLSGIMTQQEKFTKNFYIILMEYFDIPNLVTNVNRILLISFIIIYFFTCLTLLFKKQITFREEMRKAEYFLIVFLFLLITNFQPWYIMWLFPVMMWQRKEILELVIQIALISQFANSVFLVNGEGWRNGTPFTFFMLLGVCICLMSHRKTISMKTISMRQRRKRWIILF